jgi:hypothetical protein
LAGFPEEFSPGKGNLDDGGAPEVGCPVWPLAGGAFSPGKGKLFPGLALPGVVPCGAAGVGVCPFAGGVTGAVPPFAGLLCAGSWQFGQKTVFPLSSVNVHPPWFWARAIPAANIRPSPAPTIPHLPNTRIPCIPPIRRHPAPLR